jgi:hypothetical protein
MRQSHAAQHVRGLGELDVVVATISMRLPQGLAKGGSSTNLLKNNKYWRRKQSSANRSPPVGSLFHGENTGKFGDFGLEIAKAPLLSEENSIAYQQNSLVASAGKICGRSGKPEAGNRETLSQRSVEPAIARLPRARTGRRRAVSLSRWASDPTPKRIRPRTRPRWRNCVATCFDRRQINDGW